MTARAVSARDLAADAAADAWVRSIDPDPDPRLWPAPDEGRYRLQVHAAATALVVAALAAGRPGADDGDMLDELEAARQARDAAATVSPRLCSHCRLAPVRVKRSTRCGRTVTDVCGRCYEHFRRHAGRLPSARLNYRQALRDGLLDRLAEAA